MVVLLNDVLRCVVAWYGADPGRSGLGADSRGRQSSNPYMREPLHA
ncbi:hypothetical protein T261_0278 [Streptomyces lydicus]|nr:hypothetical protein T261_0278 [Streptomyces lydicus]